MGLSGLEPPTSRLSGVRSNRLSYKPTSMTLDPYREVHCLVLPLSHYPTILAHRALWFSLPVYLNEPSTAAGGLGFLLATFLLGKRKVTGGDEENRTPDPLLARQVLSQLSYTPVGSAWIIFLSTFSRF